MPLTCTHAILSAIAPLRQRSSNFSLKAKRVLHLINSIKHLRSHKGIPALFGLHRNCAQIMQDPTALLDEIRTHLRNIDDNLAIVEISYMREDAHEDLLILRKEASGSFSCMEIPAKEVPQGCRSLQRE